MAALKNIKHEKFAHGIARGMTEAKAYVDAGYKPRTVEAAASCASRMLKNVKEIRPRVLELQAPVVRGLEITTTKTLERVAAIAYGDPGELMTWSKKSISVIDSKKLTAQQRAMVSEVKKLPDGTVVVKMHNPGPFLRLVGEHQGLFSGESAGNMPVPSTTTINNDNRTVVFVDRPPPVTREQWIADQKRIEANRAALAGRPAVVDSAVDATSRPAAKGNGSNGR